MERKSKKGVINIIGGGPAGLMAAEGLSMDWEVHLYEKGKAVGRKFLVAGNGGFNLTNKAEGKDLLDQYWPPDFLASCLQQFDTLATRKWLEDLGIPTFIGSSGRVFPLGGIKPITVLQKWKDRLTTQGVHWHLKEEFIGFTEQMEVELEGANGKHTLTGDFTIFALGGASWSVTGSAGDWLDFFQKRNLSTIPFQSSNCGLNIDWPTSIQEPHAGKPLKNISLSVNGFIQKGEALITDYGLEGNAVYPLVRHLREALAKGEKAIISLDLKPNNTTDQLLARIEGKSTKNFAKALHLSSAQMALLKAYSDKVTFLNPVLLVQKIKQLLLPVEGLRLMEEAISTVGGIDRTALGDDFSFKKHPTIFTIGEMIDWDAPTGGFLLQACFAMGHQVAQTINKRTLEP